MPEAGGASTATLPEPLCRYAAYGLGIASEIALPELELAVGPPTVTVRRRRVDPAPPVDAATEFVFRHDTQYLAWRSVGAFLIRGGSEIDVDPLPGVGDQVLRLPLLGPVLAVLLHVRRLLVLHASAVAVGNRCVVFLGDKQAGKSTTAAALLRAGHRLIADDIVAIDLSDPRSPRVLPGFPQMKLDADRTRLVEDAEALPPPMPGFAKRQYRLNRPFEHTPVAAARIFVLERGSCTAFAPLDPQAALGALMRFSYVARFGRALLQGSAAGLHLSQCASIVNRVAVGRLQVPDGVALLDDTVRWIESDLGGPA